jgi:hypothetical protein
MSSWEPNRATTELELDPELLGITAETADGYGGFVAERGGEDDVLRAATLKVLAGSCWSLIDPEQTFPAFATATALYQTASRSMGFVTTICADDPDPFEPDEEPLPTPSSLAYQATELAWQLVNPDHYEVSIDPALEWLASIREWGPYPAGQLDVPLEQYLDLAVEIASSDGIFYSDALASPPLMDLLGRILRRIGEAVRLAMIDRYHWTLLESAIMPIEPEALAIGRVAHRILGPHWNETKLDDMGLKGVELVPIWVAQSLEPPWYDSGRRVPSKPPIAPLPDMPRRPAPMD